MATGVVFDNSFASYNCLWDDNHVEKPEKYERVLQRCEEIGLLERCKRIVARYRTIFFFNHIISSKFMFRPASMEELSRCHDGKYIDLIESTKDMDPAALK